MASFSVHWEVGSMMSLDSGWACACFTWKPQRKWHCNLQNASEKGSGLPPSSLGHLPLVNSGSMWGSPLPKITVLERPLQMPAWQPTWAHEQCWHHLLARWEGHRGCPAQLNSQVIADPLSSDCSHIRAPKNELPIHSIPKFLVHKTVSKRKWWLYHTSKC